MVVVLPEGQVLLEELNDALGVAEVILFELVNLVESILEGLVGEAAGGGGRVEQEADDRGGDGGGEAEEERGCQGTGEA